MAIENQRVRWADIEVEQNENDVEQTVHDIIRSMSQGSTQTKADGGSCKGLSRWVNLEAEGETSRVPEVDGGSCKGLSRWVNLETKGISPAPPLRFNRINIKNMDNDSTRSVVYNSQQDSLGWLRTQIKTKFKIPIDQQRITLYKSVLQGGQPVVERVQPPRRVAGARVRYAQVAGEREDTDPRHIAHDSPSELGGVGVHAANWQLDHAASKSNVADVQRVHHAFNEPPAGSTSHTML